MARAVTQHATPIGSSTVARTKRIPVEQRAEAARESYDEAVRERTVLQTSITTLETTKSDLETSTARRNEASDWP